MPYGLIYLITNKVNGKLYIGQTSMSLDRRWACHKCVGLRKPKHLISRAINRYGPENFTIDQICTAETREELNALEKRCIVLMDSTNLTIGYNRTPGGDGSIEFTDEIRQKMSASQLGKKHTEETKRKIGAKSKGRPLTDAQKQAISKAQTGRPCSPELAESRRQRMLTNNPFKGKKHSEETIAKLKALKAGTKPKPLSAEQLARISEANTGRTHTDDTKQKLRNYWATDEAKQKASDFRRQWWAAKRAQAAEQAAQ